jgi:hypothetical protein
VRAGLITESDLRVALAQQKMHGGRIGEHLIRVNLLTEETLARALAQQLGIPFNDMSAGSPPAIAQLLPEKFAARLQALPVSYEARSATLTVAVADPLDDSTTAELARVTGKQIALQVAPLNLLRRAIEHAYFGVEVTDEGTSEFQLVDIHGRGKIVRVDEDQELPELGTSELVPLDEEALRDDREHAPLQKAALPPPTQVPAARAGPMRIAPLAPKAPPRPTPAQGAGVAGGEAGEEALRTVLALADLLVERGYFTRAELMKSLRRQ